MIKKVIIMALLFVIGYSVGFATIYLSMKFVPNVGDGIYYVGSLCCILIGIGSASWYDNNY